jgi:hypothetical protein
LARRAHAFHRGICSRRLPTALGAGRASASPSLHPIHSITRSPRGRERSLSSPPPPSLPPYAQPAPPFPVPSLHHPPAGAGVPRDPVDRPSALPVELVLEIHPDLDFSSVRMLSNFPCRSCGRQVCTFVETGKIVPFVPGDIDLFTAALNCPVPSKCSFSGGSVRTRLLRRSV